MIKKLNLWLSKRLGISYLSSLETYKFSTSWNFWVEQYLWRDVGKEIKKVLPLWVVWQCEQAREWRITSYEAFFSKLRNNDPLDRDFKDYQKLRSSGLDEQKVLKNFKSSQYPHLDGKITNINTRYGRNMEWLHSKIFCSDTTTKMLFQPLKQCKKGSILSSERKWYVRTWMYSSKSSKYLSAQIK